MYNFFFFYIIKSALKPRQAHKLLVTTYSASYSILDGPEGTTEQCVKVVMRFFFLNYIYIHLFKLQTKIAFMSHLHLLP